MMFSSIDNRNSHWPNELGNGYGLPRILDQVLQKPTSVGQLKIANHVAGLGVVDLDQPHALSTP